MTMMEQQVRTLDFKVKILEERLHEIDLLNKTVNDLEHSVRELCSANGALCVELELLREQIGEVEK